MTDAERAEAYALWSRTYTVDQEDIEKQGYRESLEEALDWHPKWIDTGKHRPETTVAEMVEPTAAEMEALEDLGVDCETYLADCAAGPQPVKEHVGI